MFTAERGGGLFSVGYSVRVKIREMFGRYIMYMFHHCINLPTNYVQWSISIIGCNFDATFVTLYKVRHKVQVSTPASKDMNKVVDMYVINHII